MESLCRKVAASLLAHKLFFPPPLIIFYWNFGGVFQFSQKSANCMAWEG